MAELMDYSNLLSDPFRVRIPDRPTFSLLRSKAGVIGRPIKETGGTVVDQVAARSGVIRVGNGFRCPDTMTNGGTFTDATGSTCGVRILTGAVEEVRNQLRAAASNRGTARPSLPTQVRPAASLQVESAIRNISDMMTGPDRTRTRLTTSELLPEVFSTEPAQAVEAVMARRPDRLYPTIYGDVPPTWAWDLTQEDIDSDTYIRSLGAAVLADLNSQEELQNRLAKLRLSINVRNKKTELAETQQKLTGKLLDEVGYELATEIADFLELDGVSYSGRFVGRHGKIVDGKIDPSSIGVGSDREEGSTELFVHTFEAELDDKSFFMIRVTIPQTKDVRAPDLKGKGAEPLIEVDYWNTKGARERTFVPDLNGTEAQVAAARTIDFLTTGFMSQPSEREEIMAELAEGLEAGHSASPLLGIINAEKKADEAERIYADLASEEPPMSEYGIVRPALYATMKRHGFVAGRFDGTDFRHITDNHDEVAEFRRRAEGGVPGYTASDDFDRKKSEQLEQALNNVLRLMPKEWADNLRMSGVKFFQEKGSRRAFAREKSNGGTDINIPDGYFVNDLLLESIVMHELTHAVQNTDPRHREAEFVFFRRRIDAETNIKKLSEIYPKSNYDDDEVAVPDDADNAYMFKVYRNGGGKHRQFNISEISAMAMEDLLGLRKRSEGDLDMQSFMIGLLMEYGVPREQF